jgi:hypothetical protein
MNQTDTAVGTKDTSITGVNTSEDKTPSTPEEIIKTLFKEKESYQQANTNQRTEMSDIHDAYMGRIADTDPKDKSKSKESTNKLKTEISYVVPSIFSGQPEIEVEGVGEEDKVIAQILEKIINFRFDTIPQFYEVIESWVKQAVVYGTSIIKVGWKFETTPNPDGTESPMTDEPAVEVPNILDCFYNPLIQNVEDQNSLIFRSMLPVEAVKDNPFYDFTDDQGQLNREKIDGKGNASSNIYDSSRQVRSDMIQLDKAGEGMIEVYERITKDRIQTVADGKERILLRDKPWDNGINAVKFIYEPQDIPNRFEGNGVGQNTMGLGKLYNKMMNRTLDNVALTNNAYFLFAKGTKIDKKQLNVKPGGGAEIDTGGKNLRDVIEAMQFPDIKQGAMEVLNKIEDEHKRASGASDLLQGAASNKTLGQDQLAVSYASQRLELINRRFKQSLSDLAEMMIDMEIKRIQSPDAAILRIFPDQIDTGQVDQMGQPVIQPGLRQQVYQLLISDDAKNAKYNIKVKGDTTIAKNKDVQIKQLTDAYNLFGPILPANNQMEWARKILELRGVDEIDKLVPDPQQYAQMQNQMMMQGNQNPIGGQPVNGQMMGGQPTQQGISQQTYGQ